jgi:release factor glutamine methyltransferase
VPLQPALTAAIARLTANGTSSPRLTAELLLMFTLDCNRAYLYAHPERELTADQTKRYESALNERLRGVPTQYITGHQEFWGMDFVVTPAVLIPRPETEHVIETVIEIARANKNTAGYGPVPGSNQPRIADVGTGSGCIAVALAKEFPAAEIHAIDISAAALEVARGNAERHGVGSRVQFHQADLLSGFPPEFFDFVVSNPPYIGTTEKGQLQPEVLDFEPHSALFAGTDGMDVIRRLVPAARGALKAGGFLVMEIGSSLAEPALSLLANWENPTLKRDLQSLPRVVCARRPDATGGK